MMDTVNMKEYLHEYIDRADNQQLEAIYVLLEKEFFFAYSYDADTLSMFYERRDRHVKGVSKTYTVADAIESVRAGKK